MPVGERIALQTLLRAAAVTLLEEYRAAADIKLQVYRARPISINPPTAFVDSLRESIAYTGLIQRSPVADVFVIHGLFDSGEAADQRDAFVDGFIDYVSDRYHAVDPNVTVGIVEVDDDPAFVPEWLPPEKQRTYYATRFALGVPDYTNG